MLPVQCLPKKEDISQMSKYTRENKAGVKSKRNSTFFVFFLLLMLRYLFHMSLIPVLFDIWQGKYNVPCLKVPSALGKLK